VNTFGLLVSGTTGTVTFNSRTPAGTFTLPSQPIASDVEFNVLFSANIDGDTRSLHMEIFDFRVWDLAAAGTASTGTGTGTGTTTETGTRTGTGTTTGTETTTGAGTTTGTRGTGPSTGTGTGTGTRSGTGTAGPAPVTRVIGPLSGAIVEDASTITAIRSGATLSDFYTTATFTVPNSISAPWDITIAFRENPADGNEYRFTVFSSGEWRLSYGINQGSIATGMVTNLVTGPGQVNVLEITAQGVTGTARLNGIDITTLDLSLSQIGGDIWIGTATVNSTTEPGRSTPYSAFEVWTLS
jgi:hypothetical protein